MRIISQDKNHSVDFDRIHLWRQYNIVYTNYEGDRFVLGAYATDERAAEVFLDIHSAFFDKRNFYMPAK